MPHNIPQRTKHIYIIGVMFAVMVLLSVYRVPTVNAQETTKIYWTDGGGNIHRADLNGNNIEDLGVGNVSWGIAIDDVNGKIYWTNLGGGTIGRSDLDGSNAETLLTNLSSPSEVEVDTTNGHLYYIDSGTVTRTNLDGSNSQTIVSSLSGGSGLALDIPNNHIYWTEFNSDTVKRADLNGDNITPLATSNNPSHMALDIPNNKIYWGMYGNNKFQIADLDGQNVTDLETGLLQPVGIVVDHVNSKIYYSDRSKNIRQADLDGSNPTTLLNIGNSVGAQGLALGPASVPRILTTTPANNSQDVPLNVNVTITMSESLTPDLAPNISCGGQAVSYMTTVDSLTYTFDPTSLLPASSSCTLTLDTSLYNNANSANLSDNDGTSDGTYTLTFQAGTSTQLLDVNNDNIISPADAVFVSNRVGTTDHTADLNSDNAVNASDIDLVVAAIGTTINIP